MGTLLLDFLRESPLFEVERIADDFSGLSEHDLRQELSRYREYVIAGLPKLRQEISASPGELRVYGGSAFQSKAGLTQAAFYLDQVVLPDPLFPHSLELDPVRRNMNAALGSSKHDHIDRAQLAADARSMMGLSPMVAANYVKFFPTTYFFERGDVPLLYPAGDQLRSSMPAEVYRIYRESAVVRSAFSEGAEILVGQDLKPGRMISIRFGDSGHGFLYRLSSDALEVVDSEKRLVRMTLPKLGTSEPPVDEPLFRAWVEQSIDESAYFAFKDLWTQQRIVMELGLSHVTGSEMTASLLGLEAQHPDIQTFTASTLMNFEVPFFADMSATDVMRVRRSDGEAFQAFRRELEKCVRELRLETDPAKRAIKLENAIHELTEVQVGAVRQKMKQLKKGLYADAVIALGGLATSIPQMSLMAVLFAAAHGYKTWRDFQDKVTLSPAYFLWKAGKKR